MSRAMVAAPKTMASSRLKGQMLSNASMRTRSCAANHLVVASGTAERDVVPRLINEARLRGFHPKTLGADKGYDTLECVQTLRAHGVTPHVAQNTAGRRSAVDRRTTRGSGYVASQKVRKRIEEIFAG